MQDKLHELIIELLQMDKPIVSTEFVVKRLLEIERHSKSKQI